MVVWTRLGGCEYILKGALIGFPGGSIWGKEGGENRRVEDNINLT